MKKKLALLLTLILGAVLCFGPLAAANEPTEAQIMGDTGQFGPSTGRKK